jgi:predicted Ser/Thr protein kinase
MTEKAERILDKANEELDATSEKPMTIQEYVEELIDNPKIACSAHQYLLDAIDYFGKRTVFERGEEKERYNFFDDPANDSEHAVLGNTDILNEFVNDLRVIANSGERMQKIVLFSGPTATGKSELKRCILNGLREYSKTDDGARYTCEWNISNMTTSSRLSYTTSNPEEETTDSGWYRSPVQSNPYSVLPEKVRKDIADELGKSQYLPDDMDTDPFSKEVYDILKNNYEMESDGDLFSMITDERHFRVRRYVMDETQGVGILSVEDDGSVKERLLGSWMPSMLQELESKGRKDPRAFSYDGVFSQGNGCVTGAEDATKHMDVLMHLLNIPDEGHAKIDKEVGFDVDTVPIFISNPDLMEQLSGETKKTRGGSVPLEDIHGVDSLKAIKRRLFHYLFRYLTSVNDESRLLRKEIEGYTNELRSSDVNPQDALQMNGTEFAPHVIEATAVYNVVSRLTTSNIGEDLDIVDKAMLFDRGYIDTDKGRKYVEEFDIEDVDADGSFGVPVTYTRDTLRSMIHRSNGENTEVVLPDEALDLIVEGLSEAPIFGENEEKQFDERVEPVRRHIGEKQQQDVIEAILSDRQATEDAVEEYVDNLYEWEDNTDDFDEYLMKDFEIKHLGTNESDYNGQEPKQSVQELREERIIRPLNRYHWKDRDDEFEATATSLKDAPVMDTLLGDYSWDDVFKTYPNLDPINWNEPSDNTVTDEVKIKCVDKMQEMYGYSEESARLTSEKVFAENKDYLVDTKEDVTSE